MLISIRPWLLCSVLWALLSCAETSQNSSSNLEPIQPGTGFILTTSLFYTTSSLAQFNFDSEILNDNLVIESGDAVLASLGAHLGILNRGIESNIHFIGKAGAPGAQIALPNCGPHDALRLPSGQVVITCYESSVLEVVNEKEGNTKSIGLSAFADSDGVAELDHMIQLNNRLYVTAQLLDRDNQFAPTTNPLLIVLDTETLLPIDTNPTKPGMQAWELPCLDPYTRLWTTSSQEIVVGCAANFNFPAQTAILRIDPETGSTHIIADYETLGGYPTELIVDTDDTAYAMVYVPNPENRFEAQEMKVVKISPHGSTEVVYVRDGFTLTGLATDSNNHVYWGLRTTDESAGLYRFNNMTQAIEGPWKTSLPPMDIIFVQ